MRGAIRLPPGVLAVAAAVAPALATVLALGGCNIAGPAIYLIDGPPKTPAAHALADVPTVVFVDDRKNVLSRFELRGIIADDAIKAMMAQGEISKGLESRDVLNLVRRQDSDKELMPMDAIGRAAGAEQVVYVRVVAFAVTPDGYTPRPVAGAEVRVIDVVNRKRVFPATEAETGRYVEATLPPVSPDMYKTTTGRRQLEDALANALGERIATLFYDHESKELGGSLR